MTSDHPTNSRRWFQFGPYVADATKHLLWRSGTLVPLTAKAFEILLALIERRDRVVEKQELMEAVWPNTIVEENTLTRHVSTLRKALEERPEHHAYILTVPGHGYQFVADVAVLDRRPDHLQHSLLDAAPAGNESSSTAKPPEADRPVAPQPAASPLRRLLVAGGMLAAAAAITAVFVIAALRHEPAADGGPQRALRQLTFDGGLHRDPTWAPDGLRVAYASTHAGSSDLWVQTLGEPSPVQITSSTDEESQPDWSPDGGSIVFRSEQDGGGLFVLPAQGGAIKRLSTFGYSPRWSSKGSAILFSSSGHVGGTSRFYIVGLDGRSPRPLRPDLLLDFSSRYAAWRPDGQSVSIWGRDRRGEWTLLTAPLEHGSAITSGVHAAVARRMREANLELGRFVWSRSGTHIYFEGRSHETQNLWRVTVDPRTLDWIAGPDRVTLGTTRDTDAAPSPDGNRLVFSARSVRTRLWVFPFDAIDGNITGAGQPVTSGGAGELDADAPDDGSKLVYRTVRGGMQQVWERSVPEGHERLLVRGDQWERTRPRWSSDGRRLSYLRRRTTANNAREGSVVVLSVDRDEKAERLLTKPGDPEVIPSDWSADGRWVLGGCRQPSIRRVGTCLVEATDEESKSAPVRVLTADPTHNLFEQRFSPDQRWISFIAVNATDAGVSTIFIMPAAGGTWRPITDGSVYDDKPHWSPDGRTIYFVSPRNGVLNVWGRRFDSESGTPSGPAFQVTSFNTPRQMISGELSKMQIALTKNRLFLPITEVQSELWILQGLDR